MLGHDYFRSDYNSYVYFRKLLNGSFVCLLLYVDDILTVFKNIFEINSLNNQLNGEFEKNDLDVTNKILGMVFFRNQSDDNIEKIS